MQSPIVIGWKERVDFPDWGIERVRVKMDTGARTSAIDAFIRELRANPDGTKTAVLEVALFRRQPKKISVVEAAFIKMARVRNTGGEVVERLLVETTVRIGPVTKRIQLTIANRHSMLSPILIGRKALTGDFIVDVSRKFVLDGIR